jgi:hypothetical protein
MVFSTLEYSKKFKQGGKFVSNWTIIRRCRSGLLPSNHIPKKLAGKRGAWIIEVIEEKE